MLRHGVSPLDGDELRPGSAVPPTIRAMRAREKSWMLGGRGTLQTRLLLAGSLLVVGVPALAGLAYALGYPSTSLPVAVLALLASLQVLILLYALMVVTQLVVAGVWDPVVARKRRRALQLTARGLRGISRWLVDATWEHEQRGHGLLEEAVLSCIQDLVRTELEYRRRTQDLEHRRAELEFLTRREMP